MLSYSKNILQILTGKSSLNEVSEDELKQIADSYPYFGAAQFLLAKKTNPGTLVNKATLQKSALHFTNELWLHYNFFEREVIAEENVEPVVNENISEVETEVKEFANDKESTEEAIAAKEIDTAQTDESEPIVLPEAVFETEEAEEIEESELSVDETESNERLSNLLKEQAAAFEKPVEEAEQLPIDTTPHHRIDYFESQGIKLEEDKANDKLGTQLKRFTDWLKQMKRINPNLTNIESDEAGESQVQNLAEHSNEPKEVVTETMAEVLIKQGKPEQAIQIYEKLSFINPSKSAYFAAKIQELKA